MAVDSRRTFGSGLQAVLGAVTTSEEGQEDSNKQEVMQVVVHKVVPGKFQPRRVFDQTSLQELSNSISAQGILQPILVRKSGFSEYEIIAGERRWRAAQMAGLQQVPVIVCDITDESALAFGLIENIQRQDLNPMEEAFALKRLIEEFNMTHDQVAKSIGRSRASVSNMLRLLNLAKPVQELLLAKKLDVGHAKLLVVFNMDEQNEIANIIVHKNLTVRATEKIVQAKKSRGQQLSIGNNPTHPLCEKWSKHLSEKLSTDVVVKLNRLGVGSVIIKVKSSQEVESLIGSLEANDEEV